MGKILNKEEQSSVEKLVKEFESETQSEIAIVIAKSSDPYPAASLRFGVLGAFFVTTAALIFVELADQSLIPIFILLLTIFLSLIGQLNIFKKFTLSKTEMHREVKEKALEIFLSKLSSNTSHQNFALLYISLQERIVEFVVGKEIKEAVQQSEINQFVDSITSNFKEDNYHDGIKDSLNNWKTLLKEKFPKSQTELLPEDQVDEITNKIIWI